MRTISGKPKGSWEALVRTVRLILRRDRLFKGVGFEVQSLSTWDMEYRENGRTLKIGTGIGKGSKRWWDTWTTLELQGPLRWNPPHDFELIGAEKRKQIVQNLSEAFEHFEIPFEVLD